METGPKISIALHGVILGLVTFGGPLFSTDDTQAIQISEVSIITSSEFAAMTSSAPTPDAVVDPQPIAPPVEPIENDAPETPQVEAPQTPEAPEPVETQTAETLPDVQSDPDPLPEPEVEAPEVAETAQGATGGSVVVPDAQVSTEDSPGRVEETELALLKPKPRPAPRVDNTPSDKPEPDAETSKETQEATAPTEEATEQAEVKEETAPAESTTQITPDADPDSAAPIKSARPKGRPSDLNQRAIAAREAKEKQAAAAAEEERKAAEAKAIADALKAVQQTSTNEGPPLTGSEKGALVLAVQQCWNVPVGVQDAGNLVVVLSVDLTPDGKLAGNPQLIDPSGSPQGLIKQAYEAGRRALIRCAPYNLPQEKYEQWKQLEVVFNPQKMVLR